MNNRVCFATFDPLHEVPKVCGVCVSNPPIFRYEFREGNEDMPAEYMKGFCCASCAAKLLEVLKHTESQEWACEEAALEDDDMEITEVQKRRLAGGRTN